MQTFNDIDYQHGDLALLYEALQVCFDEITRLMVLQQKVNKQRLRHQISAAVDIRLKAIATMNKILLECSADILPKFSFDEKVLRHLACGNNANSLTKFIADSAQNMELIKNIKCYIQNSEVKFEFVHIIDALVQSHERLQFENEESVSNE